MRKILVTLSAILLLVLFVTIQRCERPSAEIERAVLDYVIDGDSLAVSIEGQSHIFRLIDIDAPEHDQPFDREATFFMKDKLPKDLPIFFYRGTFGQDVYGRWLVLVWSTLPQRLDQLSYAESLNALLVKEGLALPRKYQVSSPYFEQLEAFRKEAQKNKKGVHQ